MIRAECHTADNALAVAFDATPWFEEADPPSIVSVARKGWSSVWIAEALESRPGYEDLHRLVHYASTHLEGRVAGGSLLADLRMRRERRGRRGVARPAPGRGRGHDPGLARRCPSGLGPKDERRRSARAGSHSSRVTSKVMQIGFEPATKGPPWAFPLRCLPRHP